MPSDLKQWAKLMSISPGTERTDAVRAALRSSPHLRDQLFACPKTQRFVRGNHWHACALPRGRECLAVSIGIGGDWRFEDGLVKHGCEVRPDSGAARDAREACGCPKSVGSHDVPLLGPW